MSMPTAFFFSVQSFRHRVCAPATFIFVILFCFNHCTKVAAPSLCTSFFHFGDFFFNCCTKVAAPCLRTRYIYFIVQKHLLHQGCGTMSVHQLLVFLWFILVYFFNYCTKSKVAAPCLRNSYWKPGKTYYFNLIFIVQRLRHHVWSPATFIFWFIFWNFFLYQGCGTISMRLLLEALDAALADIGKGNTTALLIREQG